MFSTRVKCESCKHYILPCDSGVSYPTCDAFPDGIPVEIFGQFTDHDKPYKGDHGILYEEDKG